MPAPKKSQKVKGLYLRSNAQGKVLGWYFRYRDLTGRQHVALGLEQAEAERRALAILSRIADGKVGVEPRTEEQRQQAVLTVEALGALFLERYSRPRIKDLGRYRVHVRAALNARIVPILGRRLAAEVRRVDIEELRDELQGSDYAPRTINSTLIVLSRIFSWAEERGLVPQRNPVKGVERYTVEPTEVALEPAQAQHLLAHAAAYAAGGDPAKRLPTAWAHASALHPMIATALYAGLRKGELLGLRWQDVAWPDARRAGPDAEGALHVRRSYRLLPKSGKSRTVYPSGELFPILKAWRAMCLASEEGLVFPVAIQDRHGRVIPGKVRMGEYWHGLGLDELLQDAGLPAAARPWHMLRHTYGTLLAAACKDGVVVQDQMGHASYETTRGYINPHQSYVAAQARRLSLAPAPAAPRGRGKVIPLRRAS